MKNKRITSVSVGDDVIQILEGRTKTYEKCAIAYFAGPEGWSITMTIRLEEVEGFRSLLIHRDYSLSFRKKN